MSLFSSDYRGISAKTNGLSDSKYGEGEAATRGVTRNGLILFESRFLWQVHHFRTIVLILTRWIWKSWLRNS